MPIIVNTLKIKTNVKDSGDKKSSSSGSNTSNNTGGKVNTEERELIINECVRRTLEELRYKIGR